jgi:hypothetical protein
MAHKLLTFGTLLLLAGNALCSDPSAKPSSQAPADQNRPMSTATRFDVIRGLNAELVFVRKPFPMGGKGLTIKNGVVTPTDEQLNYMVFQTGPAAKPGDRAKITDVIIKENSIIFELNGGPKKKKKWYQHVEAGVGSSGATVPIAPDNSENARGSFVALVFDHFVPDIPPDQIKHMLAPVFDFTALSSTQAYVDTLPPKARAAVKNHEVLVGMNKEMVVASKGRPEQKIREHDDRGEYEEWIYGMPPQEIEFVRLYGDEVGRVEIMKVDGQKVVRTEREVEVQSSGMAQPQTNEPAPAPGEAGEAGAPSLRRPGEALPNDSDDQGQVIQERRVGLPHPSQSPVPGSDIPEQTPQPQPPAPQPPQQQPMPH